jgi:hypothetical protein
LLQVIGSETVAGGSKNEPALGAQCNANNAVFRRLLGENVKRHL